MSAEKHRNVSQGFWQLFCLLLAVNLFAVSASFFLFVNMAGISWGRFVPAALLMVANVAFISLLGAGASRLYTYYQVDRPLQRIEQDLETIAAGDLSVRVAAPRGNPLLVEVAESINHMTEGLAQVETLKTGFVSDVSHELKTPLTVMRNYARLLQEPDITEAQRREYAGAIADASERLAGMVSNILRLNRLENQDAKPGAEEYDLADQLASCLLSFEEVWEERGIEVEPALAEDVMVRGDRELLDVVWNNLLSNAFKFTPEGGTVSVTLTVKEGNAVVCVRDTGRGMTEEEQARIFDKFYQGDSSHATEGNGLGLALVRRILDIEGGSITVESVPGVGSAFTVLMPRIVRG